MFLHWRYGIAVAAAVIVLTAGAEIRWAFMKWAHKNFEKRNDPAAAGLMATLREVFECN